MNQRNPIRRRPLRRAALALSAAALAAALLPARAGAGLYTVVQCHPGYEAGHEDALFTRSSEDFVGKPGCEHGAGGLVVEHRASPTLAGRRGGWSLTAPPGTAFVGAAVRAGGTPGGGIVPRILLGAPASMTSAGRASGKPHRVGWHGLASVLAARLECRRAPHCRATSAARLAVNRIRLRVADRVKPDLGLAGPFAYADVVRGSRRLLALAGDRGGGVAGLSVEVNGRQAGARALECSVSRRIALRLTPCPAGASLSLAERTATAPFRQGTNRVRVCARDYAAGRDANVVCIARRLRVDNACPLSPVAGGARLEATLRGVHHGFVAARHDRPRIAGRLVDAAGTPVTGARVCLAAQRLGTHAAERVIATPRTGRNGRFRAPIPLGAARRLRVAYWPNGREALQRFARVRFRARPRLRLRPGGVLRNGDRLRFIVHLPGPEAERRQVRIEARAHRSWVPVTGGRTGAGGVYHGSYRFHATSGPRAYRFRAVVPHQAGYPYASGASVVRSKRVRG